MTLPVPARLGGTALLLGLLPAVLAACTTTVEGAATAAPADPTPVDPEELEELVVAAVPSGLPRVPDEDLTPPAGEKSAGDVAAYSLDPGREAEVLEEYGYRYGWERFWSAGSGPVTSVFVDQFDSRAGAGAYARDLAENEAALYGSVLREDPPHLPGGCRLLTVEEADPHTGLSGPAAFAWCGHGVFSVGVSAVAESVTAASDEVHAVLAAQLERLPPS
ncbi:hypothetical protein [Geodermatophilus sabuli]|uniref:Sensor domain-containing protein n=1 Tax=Geodermatophilus sabuli TaxID=1564158 RepID=A0A285EIM6_9ACTN|nr:hypothetical protein [Geodermatophilus sabuli]MBB3085844.1 hypothetical protein [Geodermatophilus sabuli]SNX98945.1 hypothetical protein SAMN06893097_11337 [Geodermatophilus sabuli]